MEIRITEAASPPSPPGLLMARTEAWVLELVERVRRGQPLEDSRVELKAEWTDPPRAARRIAGHANAAGGEPVLWVIGIDEERGVTGATANDLAAWYPQVCACFEGLAPAVESLVVPVGEGQVVVALRFDTTRAPYVVRNPVHGGKGGGPVSLEVPWREGTTVRSARRADLLRILVPLQRQPHLEVLGAWARREVLGPETGFGMRWEIAVELYVVPADSGRLVLPFHHCQATFAVPGRMPASPAQRVRLAPPRPGGAIETREMSLTIRGTEDELVAGGPGKIELVARAATPEYTGLEGHPLVVTLQLQPVELPTPVSLSTTLGWLEPEHRFDVGRRSPAEWGWRQQPRVSAELLDYW